MSFAFLAFKSTLLTTKWQMIISCLHFALISLRSVFGVQLFLVDFPLCFYFILCVKRFIHLLWRGFQARQQSIKFKLPFSPVAQKSCQLPTHCKDTRRGVGKPGQGLGFESLLLYIECQSICKCRLINDAIIVATRQATPKAKKRRLKGLKAGLI